MLTAIIIIVAVAILIFGWGPLKTLLRGFGGVFVEDIAKTPQGAEAIYNQALTEAQEKYTKANNTLQTVAGQLDSARKQKARVERDMAETQKKCEAFAQSNQFDKVKLFAAQLTSLKEDLEAQNVLIGKLEPLYEDAKTVNTELEAKVTELRREKDRRIAEMKTDKQMTDLINSMDELRSGSATDNMLAKVRNGAKELNEQATGARVVHENKTSTQLKRAEDEAKKMETDAYVEELHKRFQKPQE